MAQIDVTEFASSVKLDGLDDIVEIDHGFEHEYNPDYFYYITYDRTQNGKIISLVGFLHKIEKFNLPDIKKYGAAEVNINQDQYEILKFSFDSKELLTFYNEENDEIFFRRLHIELIKGNFDKENASFASEDNIIRIAIAAVDSNDNPDDDIKELRIKKLRSGGDINSISSATFGLITQDKDGNDVFNNIPRKAKIPNPAIIEINMNNSDTDYTILRIKAYVPGLDNFWLSIYPKFLKINPPIDEIDLTS